MVVENYIDFPLEWGLGSSSTLIYNIAQWAYISPFELHFKTCNGSGYDIACAQSEQPIIFSNDEDGPSYSTINFDPPFKQNLCLVHLNKKAKSYDAIKKIQSKRPFQINDLETINNLTDEVLEIKDLKGFEDWIMRHEKVVSQMLGVWIE